MSDDEQLYETSSPCSKPTYKHNSSRKRKEQEETEDEEEEPVVEHKKRKKKKRKSEVKKLNEEGSQADEESYDAAEYMSSPVEKKRKKSSKKKKHKKEQEENVTTVEEKKAESSNGRHYTIAIALPGSIIANAQSPELKSYLAGQVARAAAVFNVDEIVVFDETGKGTSGAFEASRTSNPNVFLAHVLQYLEMPQYLRKSFFPQHPNLRYAGLLNPLDSPHHMRIDEDVPYRDGVTLDRPTRADGGSLVNCGMRKEVRIDRHLVPGTRVTVQMHQSDYPNKRCFSGTAVAPSEPRVAAGFYWGYTVRLASCLSDVFTSCPHKGGYDLTIGTSERGKVVDDISLPEFKHLLIVFGGVQGLETSLEADESLDVDDVSLLFDYYVNTCPDQGSRTIRTEEAMLISLASLRPKIVSSGYRPRA